jgi:hypothetical protein
MYVRCRLAESGVPTTSSSGLAAFLGNVIYFIRADFPRLKRAVRGGTYTADRTDVDVLKSVGWQSEGQIEEYSIRR